VCRNTWVSHGRVHKPPAPLRGLDQIMVSLPEHESEHEYESDENMPPLVYSDDDSDDSDDSDDDFPGDDSDDSGEEGDGIGRGKLTRKEVTMLVLDWIASKKVTDAAAEMMWEIVTLMMPEDAEVASWHQIKGALRKAEKGLCQRIEMCPNDCIAYWDSKHLPQEYKHARRTKCPLCNTTRYVTDPADGKERARKVAYIIACIDIIDSYVDIFYIYVDIFYFYVDIFDIYVDIFYIYVHIFYFYVDIFDIYVDISTCMSTYFTFAPICCAGGLFLPTGSIRAGPFRTGGPSPVPVQRSRGAGPPARARHPLSWVQAQGDRQPAHEF
jgi:hypothetical protein